MKVLLHYEDHEDAQVWKTLKITLPKSWKTGPTSKLLDQFVESYNASTNGQANPLTPDTLHLALRTTDDDTKLVWTPLASDAIVIDCISDREDIYVQHGPAPTLREEREKKEAETARILKERENTVQCALFGCDKRFPKGGPYPDCQYHTSPPVFHETAKFWSCCPTKKAYDWDVFQKIPGCQFGKCSETPLDDTQKQFLGGTDLREAAAGPKLKSIDDFNRAQEAGGAEAAPVLERLQRVLEEVGVEKELYEQVVEGMKKELQEQYATDADLLEAVKKHLGDSLKSSLKTIAAEQLRIK